MKIWSRKIAEIAGEGEREAVPAQGWHLGCCIAGNLFPPFLSAKNRLSSEVVTTSLGHSATNRLSSEVVPTSLRHYATKRLSSEVTTLPITERHLGEVPHL
jgi:hypothetical protein